MPRRSSLAIMIKQKSVERCSAVTHMASPNASSRNRQSTPTPYLYSQAPLPGSGNSTSMSVICLSSGFLKFGDFYVKKQQKRF